MTEETNQPFQAAPEPSPQPSGDAKKSEEDVEACIFCKNMPLRNRKIGYYVTLAIGIICFTLAISGLFSETRSPVWYTIGGTLIVIFCPLWVANCKKIWDDLKNPIRLVTSIVMVISLVCLILLVIFRPSTGSTGDEDDDEKKEESGGFSGFLFSVLIFIADVVTVLSSIWYVLSFHPTIQEKVKNCLVCCCNKMPNPLGKKEESPQQTQTTQPSNENLAVNNDEGLAPA